MTSATKDRPSGPESWKRFLPGFLLAGIVFFGLFTFGDAKEVSAELRSFAWIQLPGIITLVCASYALRWFKWHTYLRILQVELGRKDSVIVFLAGFVMCITPAKLGEALKAYFLRQMIGTPIARIAPVVLAERFTDLVAMLILASLGASLLPHGPWILLGISACLMACLVALGQKRAVSRLLSLFKRGPLQRVAQGLQEAHESASALLSLRNLILPVLLSLPAWWMECIAFERVTAGLHAPIGLFKSTILYAFSTLAGAVSLLPGGLALTEGTLAGALHVLCGFSDEKAAAATLLIRAFTLWFAFVVGVATCLLARARLSGSGRPPLASPPNDALGRS